MIRATKTDILSRIIAPDHGELEPRLAEYILKLDFPASDHRRIDELSTQALEGALSSEEESELEGYLHINDFLAIVQSKARLSLQSAAAP
jgi:hypothetical protein